MRQGLDRLVELPPLPQRARPASVLAAPCASTLAAGCRSPSASTTCSSKDRCTALLERAVGLACTVGAVLAFGAGRPNAAATAASSDQSPI